MNRTNEEDNTRLSILVVEDNPGDLWLLREMFKQANMLFDVTLNTVGTLNSALIKLSETEFDAIILDLGLPDSHGLPTLQSIRSHAKETPILVLTGLDDEELGIKAVRQGAQDYLVKGQIDSRLLHRSLMYSVERFRLERELKKRVDEIERLNRMLQFDRDMEIEDLRREIQRLKEKRAG